MKILKVVVKSAKRDFENALKDLGVTEDDFINEGVTKRNNAHYYQGRYYAFKEASKYIK